MPDARARHRSCLLALGLLLCATAAAADEAPDESWRAPRPVDGLYARIAEDLKAGRPLIVAAYYGMWFAHADQPERNLNWTGRYGHSTMLRRAGRNRHVRKLYRHTRWKLLLEERSEQDPLRTLVFGQTVRPNRRWRRLGVTKPFEVLLVMQAYASQVDAAVRMTHNLRRDSGRTLELSDGRRIDVGRAQATGYFGHNLFYDHADFEWDGLRTVPGRPSRPKGLFVVGCNTARVPGFPALIDRNVHALLLSRSLMASEGYSTLALVDGLLRGLGSRALVRLADDTYRYFQQLERPKRRVGKPFVSHDFRMYPAAGRVD